METNRLFFEREALSKEVTTSAAGIKHTYHVRQRPEGPAEEPLVLRMRTSGNMTPVEIGDHAVLFRGGAAGLEMVYDGLYVTDATGRELPARFRPGGGPGGFEIHVDDRGAVYPVAIDPLFRPLGEGGIFGERDTARLVIDGEATIVRVHDGLVLVGVPGYDLEVFTQFEIERQAIGGVNQAIGSINLSEDGLWNDLQGFNRTHRTRMLGVMFSQARALLNAAVLAGIIPAPRIEDVGVVYAYSMIDGKWTLLDALNDWNEAAKAFSSPTPSRYYVGARFGESIAVADAGIIIGAPGTWMQFWVNAWGFGSFMPREHVVGSTYLYDRPGSAGFLPPLALRGIEFIQGETWPYEVHDAYPQLGKMVAVGERHAIATSAGRFNVMDTSGAEVKGRVGEAPLPQTKLHHFVKQGRQWVRIPDQRALPFDHALGFIDLAIVGTDAYVLKRIDGGMRLEMFPCLETPPPSGGIVAAMGLNLPGLHAGQIVAGRNFLTLATPQSGMVRVIRKTTTLEVEEIPAPEGVTEWGEHVTVAGEGILISGKSGETHKMYYYFRNAEDRWTRVEEDEVPFPGGLRSLSASGHTVAALGRSTLDANKSELRLMPFNRSISGTATLPNGSPAAGQMVFAIPQEEHGFPAYEATLFDGANFVPFTQKPWTINRNYGCALHFFVPDAFPFIDTFKLRIRLGDIPPELEGRSMIFHVSLPLQSYTWGDRELFDLPAFGSGRIQTLASGEHEVDLWFGGGFQQFANTHNLSVIGDWQIRVGITGPDLGHRPHVPVERADLVIVESKRAIASARTATTDAQGRFSISGLAPGSYRIQPYFDSLQPVHFPYRGGTETYDLSRSPIITGAALQLQGNQGIFGRVTIQGQNAVQEPGLPPIPELPLVLTESGSDFPLAAAVTDDAGDYVMNGLESGARLLSLQGKWGPADGSTYAIPVSVSSASAQVDVTIPPFQAAPLIEVRNAAGGPAAHVKIRIRGPFGYDREVTTDSSGLATMPGWNAWTPLIYPGVYLLSGEEPSLDWSAAPVEIHIPGGDEPDADVPTPVLQAIGSEITLAVSEAGAPFPGLQMMAARVTETSQAVLAGSAGDAADPIAHLVHQSELLLDSIDIQSNEFDRITGITLRHDGGVNELISGEFSGREDLIYELTGPDGQVVELGPPQLENRTSTNHLGQSITTTRRMDAAGPFHGLAGGTWHLKLRLPYPTASESGESLRRIWTLEIDVQRYTVGERRTAWTNAEGLARFADLSGGDYLFLPAVGFAAPQERLVTQPGLWRYARESHTLGTGVTETLERDVRRAHEVSGSINSAAGAVAGVRVLAREAASGEVLQETRSDRFGQFSLSVFSEDVDLVFLKQGYEFASSEPLSWRPLTVPERGLRIQAFPVGSISGTITDAEGTARAGVPIRLVAQASAFTGNGGPFESSVVTDFPLQVESDLTIGSIRLEVRSSHLQARLFLIHPSGKVVELIDINNEARFMPRVIFDDLAELPRYGLISYVNEVYRPTEPLSELVGLPAEGVWRLRVITPFVNDTLFPVSGILESWTLMIEPESSSGRPAPRLAYTDEEGQVSFGSLPPWFYRLEVAGDTFRIDQDFGVLDLHALEAGASLAFSAVAESPRVLVRVRDAEGDPVEGATVRLDQDGFIFGGTSDASGEAVFNLPVTAGGRASAWVDPTAYGDPREVSFSFDDTLQQTLEITLRPRGAASVSMTLPDEDRVYPYPLDISQLEVDAETSGWFAFTRADGTLLGSLYHMTTQPVQQYWSGVSVPTLDAGDHPIHWTFQPDDSWTFSEGTGTLGLTVAPQPATIHTPQTLTTPYNGLPQDLRVLTTTSYRDDFEDAPLSEAAWTRGGTNGNTWVLEPVDWQAGDAGPEQAHSGENVFSVKLGGPQNQEESAWIRSPVIDLRGMGSAVLRFSEWRHFGWWHRSLVTVRDPVTLDVLEVVADTSGDFGGWKNQEFQLSPASLGREVVIEFWLEGFTTADGDTWWWPQWFLDDVEISAASPVLLSTTPPGLPLVVLHNGSEDLPVNAGTYQVDVTISDPNYSGSASFAWTIEPIPVTLTWSHDRAVYDGTSQIPAVTTDPPGIAVTIHGPTQAVNAGTYEFTAVVSDPNYSGSSSLTLVIERAPQVIDFPPIADRTYGDPPILLGASIPGGYPLAFQLIQGEGEFDVMGMSFVPLAAGEFEIEAREWMENPNYLPAEPVRRTFRVDHLDVDITLLLPGDAVYSGDAFVAEVVAPAFTLEPQPIDWLITYNGDPEPPRDAGAYEVVVTGKNSRYRGSASGEFTIARKPLQPQVPASLTFTGEPLMWPVEGIPEGVSFVREFRTPDGGTVLGDVVTDAGSYRLLVQVTGPNHEGSLDTAVDIVPAEAVITVLPSGRIYDGQAQLPDAVTMPAGLSLRWELQQQGEPLAAAVNAGVYDFQVFVDDPNFTGTASGSFAIARAGAVITFGELEATYNGESQLPVFSSEPAGLTARLTITRGGETVEAAVDAGVYEIGLVIDEPNYAGSATAMWTILPAALEIFWTGTEVTYNGQAQDPSPSTAPAEVALQVTGPLDAVNAGTYEFIAVSADPNYAGESTVTLTILPAPQEIVFPEIANRIYGDGAVPLQASVDSGRPVSYRLIEGSGAFPDGTSFLPGRAGTFVIEAREDAEDTENYLPAEPRRQSFTVALQEVGLALRIPQDAVYSGNPVTVTAEALAGSFAPEDWTITYDGSADAPVNAGSYEILVLAANDRYQGSASGTLVIAPLALEIAAEDVLIYQGGAQVPPLSGIPAGVAYSVEFFTTGDPAVSVGATVTGAGSYRMVVGITDGNYSGGLEQVITVLPAEAALSAVALETVYDGTTQWPAILTSPPGLAVRFSATRGEASVTPEDAGVYQVSVTLDDPNYTGTAEFTWTIQKAPAVIEWITPAEIDYRVPTALEAVASSGEPVAFEWVGGMGELSGGTLTLVRPEMSSSPDPGPASVRAVAAESANFLAPAAVVREFFPQYAAPQITIGIDQAQFYTGQPITPVVTTTPAGLDHVLIFTSGAGSSLTAPSELGLYTVEAIAEGPGFFGRAESWFRIFPGNATITVANAEEVLVYDGTPKLPLIVTDPPDLAYEMIMTNGVGQVVEAAVEADSYLVTATITDPSYFGMTSALWVIHPVEAVFSFPEEVDGEITRYFQAGLLVPAPLVDSDPPDLPVRLSFWKPGMEAWTQDTPQQPGRYTVIAEPASPSVIAEPVERIFVVRGVRFAIAEAVDGVLTRTETGLPVQVPQVTAVLEPENRDVAFSIAFRGTTGTGASYGPSSEPPAAPGDYWIDVTSTEEAFPGTATFVLRVVSAAEALVWSPPEDLEQGQTVDLMSLLAVPEGTTVTLEQIEGPLTRSGTVIWGEAAEPALLNLPRELQQGWVDLDLSPTRGIAALANGTVVTWGAPDGSNIRQLAPEGSSRVAAGEHEFAALNPMSGILVLAGPGARPEVEIDPWLQGSFREIKAGHSFFLARTRDDDVMTFGTRSDGMAFPATPWNASGAFTLAASGDLAVTWNGWSLALWGDDDAVDGLEDYPEDLDMLEISRLLVTPTGAMAIGYDWNELETRVLSWGDAPQPAFPPYSLDVVEEAALGDGFAMLINDLGTSRELHLWGSRVEVVNHVPDILSAPGTEVTAVRASRDLAVVQYTTPDYRVAGIGEVTVHYRLQGGPLDGLLVERSFMIMPFKVQDIDFPAIGHQLAGSEIPLAAQASSGLPVSYTITGPAEAVFEETAPFAVSGLRLTGLGEVRVTAAQPGDLDWLPAPEVTRIFMSYGLPEGGDVTLQRSRQDGAPAPLRFSAAQVLAASSDPLDGALSLTGADAASIRGAQVQLQGGWIWFTPVAGDHQTDQFAVFLSNPWGGEATATVTVTVRDPEADSNPPARNIVAFAARADAMEMHFVGIPGRSYQVQRAVSLVNPEWISIGTYTLNTEGRAVFTDTEPPLSGTAFYRTVRIPPEITP